MIAKPRVFMVTGTPPGAQGVGEVILRDLVLHHGVDVTRCAAIPATGYRWIRDERLAGAAIEVQPSPLARARRPFRNSLGALVSAAMYRAEFEPAVRARGARIGEAAKAWGADVVLGVLNSPVTFGLARRVAARIGRPLVSLVWDPPEYLLRQGDFDRISRRALMREFAASLEASTRVAVVSESMQTEYAPLTRAPIELMRYGPAPAAGEAGLRSASRARREFIIGFSGQMYARSAWAALLEALDRADWTVCGLPVRIRLYAPHIQFSQRAAVRIEYLGYPPPEVADEGLSDCDLLYLPHPFEPEFAEFSRLSFPTKLSAYAQVRRPVFVHAPPDGALAAFARRHPIGCCVSSLEPEPILTALETLLGSTEARRRAEEEVQRVRLLHFDNKVFLRAVDWLLSGERRAHDGEPATQVGRELPAQVRTVGAP